MNNWTWHIWGIHGLWWIFWVILIVGAAWLIYLKSTGNNTGGSKDSPLEILKKRYAKGEISKEEYEETKKTLS
ncbi:SHOCT domain-containing protein [Sinomicrobium weinanense]|uniref:SHOCT domain-containing protein n=1 Tax=Sinomicrobium weinanense TaxID=2842200 RepID=A0A926JR65_9FLAO|nr:SHOCT domain-containing protein [Sinomicrobium weinanense]MBC9795783.1 SHOCT domain-containing protein [Sinomicrobium weinanense]MBU3121827.1 SHOCT domain-containing protein [Sinomicrobium weinanense]